MKHLLLYITIILFSCPSFAQDQSYEQKFQMAMNFERIGDWENAVKLYEELYRKNVSNIVIYDALLRSYDQLKRYDDAIIIIKTQLKTRQGDIGLLTQLGKMYARAGETNEAVKAWETAINSGKNNIATYYSVANVMIENRMIEQAIKVYQKGRPALGDPYVFATDLGYLHSIFMNYSDATKEYLLLLKQNQGQLSFVQSRISLYTNKPDGLKAAVHVVEKAQNSESTNTALIQLLAWLYMEDKQYDKAFTKYIILDEMLKAQGREIFNFAERASREKAYHIAVKSYSHLIENYKNFQNFAAVRFGIARTLEDASSHDDTLKIFRDIKPFDFQKNTTKDFPFSFADAVKEYNKVILDYPSIEFAAKALLRIAHIYHYNLFNTEEALKSIIDIGKNYSQFISTTIDMHLLAGNVYLAKNDLETALEKFNWLSNYQGTNPDVRDKAKYMIAEIYFYQGKFKESLQLLESLSRKPNTDVANDAIALSILINENITTEADLNRFAKIMLTVKQRHYSQAAETLSNIFKTNPDYPLTEIAIMMLGDIYAALKKYDDAVKSYEDLIIKFPDNIDADKALLKTGYIYQFGTRNNSKAIAAFEKILENYSNSVYSGEARKRIRELRGDNL